MVNTIHGGESEEDVVSEFGIVVGLNSFGEAEERKDASPEEQSYIASCSIRDRHEKDEGSKKTFNCEDGGVFPGRGGHFEQFDSNVIHWQCTFN